MQTAGELPGADHDALGARRNRQRVILHVFTRTTEDGMQQFLFRVNSLLLLGRPCRPRCRQDRTPSSDANDAVLIEVRKGFFGDVGDVPGELLAAKLGLTDLDIKVFDVNRGEGVVLHKLLVEITIASSKL